MKLPYFRCFISASQNTWSLGSRIFLCLIIFLFPFFYPVFSQNITLDNASEPSKSSSDRLKKFRVYPHYVSPENYADYTRRPFKTPTWKTFNDTVQFVGGRSWGRSFGFIEQSSPYWIKGAKVLRPNFSDFNMSPDSLRSALHRMKLAGQYLFNINAYGPGSPVIGRFGQVKIDDWKVKMMKDSLEDRFMGYDLGEQDGRYWADSRSVDYPMSPDHKERYLNAMKYMRRAAMDQGGVISLLAVKWFWHYPVKDGFIAIAGAETQNKTYTTNDQVHYAFLRGASKQYGILNYGDISVFNSWGWKAYSNNELSEKSGPEKGNSVSWMKRMMLSQYQYNCAILGFEGSAFDDRKGAEPRLSPIGILQTDMQAFIKKQPRPGPQFTPVALMLDFFSGWMSPSEPFSDKYKVWNYLPYQSSDFLTHNLLKMYYPRYDEVGLHKNEAGGLCNTPYGDALDILLSDAKSSLLTKYQIVVVADDIKTDKAEVGDKLKHFVKTGGHLVISKTNALRLLPEMCVSDDKISVQQYGSGKLSVINFQQSKGFDSLTIATHAKTYLDSLFKATRIFSVGDSLGYITNIEGKGRFMVGIYNHSLKSQPFHLKSYVGRIKSISEVLPIRNLVGEEGYFPEGYANIKAGRSDGKNIAAGDVRFFNVDIDDSEIKYLPKYEQERRVEDHYIAVPSLVGLPAILQTMPTFFDFFSGIKINWRSLEDIDYSRFKEDSWWYNLKKMQVAVELDSNFFLAIKTQRVLTKRAFDVLQLIDNVALIIVPEGLNKQWNQELRLHQKELTGAKVVTAESLFLAGKGKVNFSAHQTRPIIIDFFNHSWDVLYPVAKAMQNGSEFNFDNLSNKTVTVSVSKKVKRDNRDFYFSYHSPDVDIYSLLSKSTELLDHFGGVKIDGSYLYYRSEEKCRREAALLRHSGIRLIVDLTRETNNYPDLTWLSEIPHAYARSTEIRENILRKMQVMGIKDIIIGSHMRPEQWNKDSNRTPEESISAGITAFVKKAKELGTRVSIQNMMYKHYPSRLIATPNEVIGLVKKLAAAGYLVGLSADLSLGENRKELVTERGFQLNSCIVANKGSETFEYKVPVSGALPYSKLGLKKRVSIVFDADYKSQEQLISDKKEFVRYAY